MRSKRPLRERFEEKYEPVPWTGCWLWTGAIRGMGYGAIGLGGRKAGVVDAHRASWMLHRGEIPDGMIVCHSCDVPSCVNPDHLFLGTQQDNLLDMWRKNRQKRGAFPPGVTARRGARGVRYLAHFSCGTSKRKYLGTFKTPEEAAAVSAEAKRRYVTALEAA